MAINKMFRSIPQNVVDWGRFFKEVEISTDPGTVTDESFANRSGLSVIGRSASTTGKPADINASANGQFLGRRSDVVGFFGINDGDLPSSIARDSEVTSGDAAVTSAFQAADAAHVAASDPHTQYRKESDNVPYAEVSGKPAALALLYTGTGSPESVITAGVGALYLRTDGGAGTCLYVKESGTGNTGWVAK